MLPLLSKLPSILGKSWGVAKNILPLAPSAIETMQGLFLKKKTERKDQMTSVLSRGFDGIVDVLDTFAQQHETMGDLAVITEYIFEKPENKTLFDQLSISYLILEKIPFLGSYVESQIEKIPGFLTCAGLLDGIFGTTFKEKIEAGDKEATSQVVKMLLQLGDLIMTQVNMSKLKNTVKKS